YAVAALPAGGGFARLRSRAGALCTLLAVALALIAATPYAYLEPRAAGADSRWASYLGPYPSSIDDTGRALRARGGYLREQLVMQTLGRGDAKAARTLLAAGDVTTGTLRVALPLLAGLEGRP